MQIVCDQCGKKYKTREKKTKPFKIRCTQCPNVFVVDPSKLQDDEATRQVSKEVAESLLAGPAKAAQAETPTWYAVVQEQQAGPFTVSQLTEMWSQGKVSDQTYVWKDGMGGWELITSVPELSKVSSAHANRGPDPQAAQREAAQREVAQREAAQRESAQREAAQREAAQREAAQREAAQREAAQREAARIQMRAQVEVQHSPSLVVNKMTSPKPDSGLLASSGSLAHESREPSSVLTTAQLKNQRNDNSVLFSLDAIEGLAAASPAVAEKAKSSVTNTGGTEGSGLIDISALGSSFGGPGSSGSESGGRATINLTSGMKKPPMISKSSSSLPLILVSAVLLLMIASGGGFYVFVFQPQQQAALQAALTAERLAQEAKRASEVASNLPPALPTQNVTPGATTPPQVQTSTQQSPQVAAVSPTSEEPSTTKPETKAVAKKPKPRTRSRKTTRRNKATRARRSTKPAAKPAPSKPKSSEASSLISNLHGGQKKSLPPKPSKGAIQGAMRKVNVSRCSSYEPKLKGKKAFVQVKIESSGRVQSATSLPPIRGTTTGSCLEREVRKQKVPPFKEKDVSFKYPFTL